MIIKKPLSDFVLIMKVSVSNKLSYSSLLLLISLMKMENKEFLHLTCKRRFKSAKWFIIDSKYLSTASRIKNLCLAKRHIFSLQTWMVSNFSSSAKTSHCSWTLSSKEPDCNVGAHILFHFKEAMRIKCLFYFRRFLHSSKKKRCMKSHKGKINVKNTDVAISVHHDHLCSVWKPALELQISLDWSQGLWCRIWPFTCRVRFKNTDLVVTMIQVSLLVRGEQK